MTNLTIAEWQAARTRAERMLQCCSTGDLMNLCVLAGMVCEGKEKKQLIEMLIIKLTN